MLKVKVKGNDFERLLAKRNLSHNAFAARLGISGGYLSQLVREERYPSAELRAKVLRALRNVTFDDIFEILDDELRLTTSKQTKEL